MFQLWLRKPKASWNQLVDSLRCIDLDHLASEIEMLLQPKPAGLHVIVLYIANRSRWKSFCSLADQLVTVNFFNETACATGFGYCPTMNVFQRITI